MNVFSIPTSTKCLKDLIHFYSMSSDITIPIVNKNIALHLKKRKQEIDEVNDQWDYTKKLTNPYEYIHTPVPITHVSIAKYKPLSRAYFKMIEILDEFQIEWTHPIRSFHLAEGPGGFIEAILKRRKNPDDSYTGMTLLSSDYNTPGWRKSQHFLNRWRENVSIEYGHDGTGNLFTYENYKTLKRIQHTHEFVTGDGGFDFSVCYNMQECMSSRLIFAQMVYALMLQKEGGVFVLKIFDCFTRSTIDMLWILSTVYRKMDIIKPCTSRFANSERYVVCRDYRQKEGDKILPELENILSKLETPPPGMHIQRILKKMPPVYFLNHIEEMNAVLGQQQMDMIRTTLDFIYMKDDEKKYRLKNMYFSNLQKCVNWCKNHKEMYMSVNQTYAEVLSSMKYKPPK